VAKGVSHDLLTYCCGSGYESLKPRRVRIARRPSAADGFALVVDPFTLACTRPFIRPAMHSTSSAEAFRRWPFVFVWSVGCITRNDDFLSKELICNRIPSEILKSLCRVLNQTVRSEALQVGIVRGKRCRRPRTATHQAMDHWPERVKARCRRESRSPSPTAG
jgi:hypothetical protein